MSAKDKMIPKEKIAQLGRNDTVDNARDEMKRRAMDFVLIKPPWGSAVWMIFTEEDLIKARALGNSAKTRATECASSLTKGANEDDAESECLQIMARSRIKHLGIVDDNGNLTGVLCGKDID